jgi:hypothetical protein
MPFMRLTLWGGFASLQSESRAKGSLETSARVASASRVIRSVACVMLATVVGLTGCASISPTSSAERKQTVVAERAQARWDLLLKGDVGSAYQFLSAGSKATTPVEEYKAQIKPGMWRQVKVGKVDCEGEICKVVMMVTYDWKRIKGIETPVDETWIIENGSAWYIYR